MIKVTEHGFIYDTDGVWYPPMNRKQLEIFNDYHRYLLIHGPRKSGKTFGIVHKVLRHAYDVNGAMIGIVTKTIKNAKSAGVWVLLTKMIRIWEKGCHGFVVLEGPKMTADSKMSFVRIRNRHGSTSEIQCHSLEYCSEVEAKFKGPAYSLFWLSELDQYCDEHAFDIFCDALRMWPSVAFEEHQIVCDCNPPTSGTDNWIYRKWFTFKNEKTKEGDEEDEVAKAHLHEIKVMIDDNPQLDPREKLEIKARYRKRKGLYDRFILGLWVQDITDGFFSDVWDEAIHVIGNIDVPEPEREVLIPSPSCTSLLCGWDVGESKNHSWHLIEKVVTEDPKTKRAVVSFSVLDELVVIKTHISVEDFTESVQAKINHWKQYWKKEHNRELTFRHWSDSSAFIYSARSGTTDAALVFEASNGKIILNAAPKYRDSNRDKVKLLWQFLYMKRLFVSAQLSYTRRMFANLVEGSAGEYVKRNDWKHPFDSLAYPIIAEAPQDMVNTAEMTTATKGESPGLVVASI